MKLGCGAWLFSSPRYQPPYDEAVKTIGEMGFKGIELIAFEEQDFDNYYTPTKIGELRKSYQSYGMELTEFAMYTQAIEALSSLDSIERERAFDVFKRATKVARELGSKAMNLVTNWPYGVKCPHPYPPSYFTPFVRGVLRSTPTLFMEIPHIDYTELWDTYMDTLRMCLDYVVENDMEFYIEGHAGVIVSGTDSMLRMFDCIKSDALGINLDIGWHMTQREYLPITVKKLGKKIRHVHLKDCDGQSVYNLPCGKGIVDWPSFFTSLDDVGFHDYVSLEIGAYNPAAKYILESKEFIEKQLSDLGLLN